MAASVPISLDDVRGRYVDCAKDDAAAVQSDTESTIGASSRGARAPSLSTYAGSSDVRCGSRPREIVSWAKVTHASKLRPYVGAAHCADDIYLLSAFFVFSGLNDISGQSAKLLLRVLKFLRFCDYSAEDICSIMAHAGEYVKDVLKICGDQMDPGEVGHVVACLTFIAHSWVQDETCPLRVWHKHIFKGYCAMDKLNLAVGKLLELRRHRLRLPDVVVQQNMQRLHEVIPWSFSLTPCPEHRG
mmetsp:Transcript_111664/g.312097  ORF Transcript_111664/g.312097 Transcript_111664/m.312097 type:complete len:244 (+) Transcript_111664:70-801(+)